MGVGGLGVDCRVTSDCTTLRVEGGEERRKLLLYFCGSPVYQDRSSSPGQVRRTSKAKGPKTSRRVEFRPFLYSSIPLFNCILPFSLISRLPSIASFLLSSSVVHHPPTTRTHPIRKLASHLHIYSCPLLAYHIAFSFSASPVVLCPVFLSSHARMHDRARPLNRVV